MCLMMSRREIATGKQDQGAESVEGETTGDSRRTESIRNQADKRRGSEGRVGAADKKLCIPPIQAGERCTDRVRDIGY